MSSAPDGTSGDCADWLMLNVTLNMWSQAPGANTAQNTPPEPFSIDSVAFLL